MPLETQEAHKVLQHAWDYGHFRNPAFPNTHDVQERHLHGMNMAHPAAKDAVRSMQASDIQLESLVQMAHLRPLNMDGDAGPATVGLTKIPRCSVPDFGSNFGEAGVGGWLDCDPESDADHSVRIRFDDRRATPTWRSYLDQVKQNAVNISADIGLAVRHLPHDASDWESQVSFKNIPGGVIGYYYLPSRGCDSIRNQMGSLDTAYNPDVELASLLWIHEGLGHGIALGHTRGGIMNPTIIRTEMSWRNDPSWSAVKRLYGGVPITPPEPEPTPPGSVMSITHVDGGVKIKVTEPGEYLVKLVEWSGI